MKGITAAQLDGVNFVYRSGVFRFACADRLSVVCARNSQPNIVRWQQAITVDPAESGGHGLGNVRLNNFNTGRLFPSIAGNVPSGSFTERGDEAGVTRFHRHCAGRLAACGKHAEYHYFATSSRISVF